jgi:hypothetical protein
MAGMPVPADLRAVLNCTGRVADSLKKLETASGDDREQNLRELPTLIREAAVAYENVMGALRMQPIGKMANGKNVFAFVISTAKNAVENDGNLGEPVPWEEVVERMHWNLDHVIQRRQQDAAFLTRSHAVTSPLLELLRAVPNGELPGVGAGNSTMLSASLEQEGDGTSKPESTRTDRYVLRETGNGIGEAAFGATETKFVTWSAAIKTIHYLFQNPNEDFDAVKALGGKTIEKHLSEYEPREKRKGVQLKNEPVVDPEGLAAIDNQIRQLQAALAESEKYQDPDSAATEEKQVRELMDRRKAMMAKLGKSRKANTTPEDRASATVRQHRTRAIEQLRAEGHAELSEYVALRITTGLVCRFDPGHDALDWQL